MTLPYTEAAWGAINALGARVDERLSTGDVRLTVGGEPTFVSIDNQVDPEWTTDADGPHKRQRAVGTGCATEAGVGARWPRTAQPGQVVSGRTVAALADRAVLAHRRRAAVDRRRAARRPVADRSRRRSRWRLTPEQQLLGAIADGLGLPASQVRPAYEDPLARLLNSRATGLRANPSRPTTTWRPTPPTAAPRCSARLDEAVTEPAAYVLPLHRRDDDSGWASADWRLRRGRIVLLDGRVARGSAPAARFHQLAAAAGVDIPPTRWPAAASSGSRIDEARTPSSLGFRGRGSATDTGSGHRDQGRAAARLSAAQRRAGAFRRPRSPACRPRRPRSAARW